MPATITDNSGNGQVITQERTGPQAGGVVAMYGFEDNVLHRTGCAASYKTYRAMRTEPTIALARWLSIAPLVASGWTVEATDDAPDEAQEYIDAMIQPMRIHFLRTALCGCADYGHQSYEKVFELVDGRIRLRKLKPLLQDLTEILIETSTGAFFGLRQKDAKGNNLDLSVPECLHVVIDFEGTDWYGQSQMENARKAYTSTQSVDDAADRYDRKIAGSHWVVYYPVGSTPLNGASTDNFVIAQQILQSLESSGAMVVPSTVSELTEELNTGRRESLWKVELLTDSGKGEVGFINRLKYLDVQKVRAFGLPERSVLEGQFGTKAEAEAHGDFAITNMELRHEIVVQYLNWHVVNQVLRFNWGSASENSVYVVPSPIADATKRVIKQIYDKLLQNQDIALQEHDDMDMSLVREVLGLPNKNVDDISELEENPIEGTDILE